MNKNMIFANIFSPIKHRYSLALSEIDLEEPNILDVGGYTSRKTIVESFFNSFTYTSLNVGAAWYKNAVSDFLYNWLDIPFDDQSFDYVISVDVLEHVFKENRFHIINEMVRVAEKRAIVVTPFRLIGVETDESYVLDICERHDVVPPPSLVEHEIFGLPFLDELKKYVSMLRGTFKYATSKRDYWYLQTTMLWNTISLNGESEDINRRIQEFQEKQLASEPYPQEAKNAYRCVLIFDK